MDDMTCNERHSNIGKKFETQDIRLNDHAERIKKLENDNVGTARDILGFKDSLKRIEESITKIATKLETLSEKPAKRWDGLIDKIITVAVGIIIGKLIK